MMPPFEAMKTISSRDLRKRQREFERSMLAYFVGMRKRIVSNVTR